MKRRNLKLKWGLMLIVGIVVSFCALELRCKGAYAHLPTSLALLIFIVSEVGALGIPMLGCFFAFELDKVLEKWMR